jgi:ankyrin repeat protein
MKKAEQEAGLSSNVTSMNHNQGTDINREDITGQTPLMHAAECGNARIVGFLLDQGASIDQQSTHPCTDQSSALIIAAKKGHINVLGLLLERGANPNLQCRYGRYALFYAIEMRNIEMITLLINHRANINIQPENYEAPPLVLAANNHSIDIVELLLDNGADVNQKGGARDMTALMVATYENSVDMVDLVLGHGADVNLKDNYDNTALILAARKGYWDIARKLISTGATIPTSTNSFFYPRYEHIVYLMGNAGFLAIRPNGYLTSDELATLRVIKELVNEENTGLPQLGPNNAEHVAAETSPAKRWCTLQ